MFVNTVHEQQKVAVSNILVLTCLIYELIFTHTEKFSDKYPAGR